MIDLGLTGGIGAGKSYVAEVFKGFNIPVYDSDAKAKALYSVPEIADQLVKLIGKDAFLDGMLNTAFVADKLFNNQANLKSWNAVIHPALAVDYKQWRSQQSAPYVIKEAAILFESGAHKNCDKILCVIADTATRMHRVKQRSNMTEVDIKARMAKQWSDQLRVEHSDYLIFNNPQDLLLDQIIRVHEDLIRLSNKVD